MLPPTLGSSGQWVASRAPQRGGEKGNVEMQIKQIAALCKKRKVIYIATEADEQQYIGDGAALYKITGLPALCADEVMTLFDFKAKERDKMEVIERDGVPMDISDYDQDETELDDTYFTFCYGERVLLPLSDADELILIETKYLKPVSDELEYQRYFLRKDNSGNRYVVVKNGMIAQAAILPFVIEDKNFINRMYELANGLDEAAAVRGRRQAREDAEDSELRAVLE